MTLTPIWQPYREPIRATLLRTTAIAAGVGLILAKRWGGGVKGWAIGTLLAMWISFGGHWVELAFLNRIRPRISPRRDVQILARLATWFVGGAILTLGMCLTTVVLDLRPRLLWQNCWLGGLVFIGIEMIVHLALQLRGRPSFWNGRG